MCVYAHTGRGKAPGGSSLSLSPSGTLLCVCVSRELLSSCLLLDTLCGDNDTAGAGQKVLMEINEIGCAALSLSSQSNSLLSLSLARTRVDSISQPRLAPGFSARFFDRVSRARVFSARARLFTSNIIRLARRGYISVSVISGPHARVNSRGLMF